MKTLMFSLAAAVALPALSENASNDVCPVAVTARNVGWAWRPTAEGGGHSPRWRERIGPHCASFVSGPPAWVVVGDMSDGVRDGGKRLAL